MKKIIFTLLIAIGIILFGCTKKEYMVPPVGEQVPTKDSVNMTLTEYLNQSGYKLFTKAWKKNKMDSFLSLEIKPNTPLTILIPSDDALQNVGWDANKIDLAEAAELDSLVKQFVFFEAISPQNLLDRPDNYSANNIMAYKNLFRYKNFDIDLSGFYYNPIPGPGEGYIPYHFKIYLKRESEQTFINGISMGGAKPILVKNAVLWPINKVFERPTKTAISIIKERPEFGLYLQTVNYTDSLYREMFKSANGYYAPLPHFFEFNPASINYRDFVESYRMGYAKKIKTTIGFVEPTSFPVIDVANTWFIPTNQAFYDAGFKSLDDIIAFNKKRGEPKIIWNALGFYQVKGEFATDTLLNYHQDWGKMYSKKRISDGQPGDPNVTVFFSNDLRQELIGNFTINGYNSDIFNPDEVDLMYYMPFVFENKPGSVIDVKLKNNSQQAPATVTIKDLYSLNGVIHGVNKLLLPSGFKLN